MPAGGPTPSAGEAVSRPVSPITGPDSEVPVKVHEVRMIRCPAHGIAYDSEREVCPECAKGAPGRTPEPCPQESSS
jgi:hypothetical protein